MLHLIFTVLMLTAFTTEILGFECEGNTKKSILNYHHDRLKKSNPSLESQTSDIQWMLKGSKEVLKQRRAFTFVIQASGTRKTARSGNPPSVSKGYSIKELCFFSKCVGQVSASITGRSPDPESRLNEDGSVSWGQTGGGVGRVSENLEDPYTMKKHCLSETGPFARISYTFVPAVARGQNTCDEMRVKGFYMRSCIDK